MNKGEKNQNNTPIIVLLVILLVAVLGVGGYFIVKDITSGNNSSNNSNQSQSANSGSNSNQNTPSGNNSNNNSENNSDRSASSDIEAGITIAERRDVNFHVEVQTNGAMAGKCEFSIVPTRGGEGHHATHDLEEHNKVSVCSDDASIKGFNPGEHKATVIIRAADGRTKTLEKIVTIQ